MTVLVEDYFHVEAFDELIQRRNWEHFEPRYERNTHKALDLLDKHRAKATFFVLGWIAEQNPKLIREIVSRGHEVASRGFYHRSIEQLTAEEFKSDFKRARDAIESAGLQKVLGYRSADKLSFEKHENVLELLAEEGAVYDASFMPGSRTSKKKRFTHQVHTKSSVIWEFPFCTRNLGVGLLPISGGNYVRQIPYTILRHAVQDWINRYSEPFLFYFHVWELDPEQPRISAASRYNRVRHYRKLDKMEWVLNEILAKYEFSSISAHLGLSELEVIEPKLITQVQLSRDQDSRIEQIPVTVVIPCFNEAEALTYLASVLAKLQTEMKTRNYAPRFCFVDDCSTDNTLEKLHTIFDSYPNVTVLSHKTNKGVAAGIRTGLLAAKSEIVCSMDCDCTYDPLELVNMIPLLARDVDLVTASPYHSEGAVRNVPAWRLFLSKGASWLYRRTLKTKLATYTSCFRVYRKSSFENIETTENGFLGVAEMLGKLDLIGGKIVEYPAILEVRLFGFSKMKTVKTIFGHVKLLKLLASERFLRKNVSIKSSLNEKNEAN